MLLLPCVSDAPATFQHHARSFIRRVRNESLKLKLLDGNSVVGGGSAPEALLPTKLISLTSSKISATELEARLRLNAPPIIARIEDDKLLLDLRTVSKSEEQELLAALQQLQ